MKRKENIPVEPDMKALLTKTPGGIQIHTIQTLEKISTDPSQKTVTLLPNDVVNIIKNIK